MSQSASVPTSSRRHHVMLGKAGPASGAHLKPTELDVDQVAGSVASRSSGGLSPQSVGGARSSEGAASGLLRNPQEAVKFSDHFNKVEGLKGKDLADKVALMSSGGLKLSRCMPALGMKDLVGVYAHLGALSDKPAPIIWIDGDAHFGNFGAIRGKDRHYAFGLNDFDMTCKGSPAFDLDRNAYSLVKFMQEKNVEPEQAPAVVDALAHAYLKEMKTIASGQGTGLGYLTLDDDLSEPVRAMLTKSDAIKRSDWITKYAKPGKHGDWEFIYSKNVQQVDLATANKVVASLHDYEQQLDRHNGRAKVPLHIFGVAQKMQSGGSSHGQPRYIALVENADPDKAPIALEIKQELPAPLVGWNNHPAKAAAASKRNWSGDLAMADARQVVQGQTAMGGNPNPLTGYTTVDGISCLVREREPGKASLSDSKLTTAADVVSLAEMIGRALARAHGVQGHHMAGKILEWAGDKTEFSARLLKFTQAYCPQSAADEVAYSHKHGKTAPDVAAQIQDTGD